MAKPRHPAAHSSAVVLILASKLLLELTLLVEDDEEVKTTAYDEPIQATAVKIGEWRKVVI